jgi:hypothetical protein
MSPSKLRKDQEEDAEDEKQDSEKLPSRDLFAED